MAKDTKINNKASSLMEKILKNSTIKQAEPLLESDLLQEKETTSTKIPMVNLALGGKFVGGLGAGITTIAGPSKHFKTSFGLVMVAAFLDKYQDAVCIFLNNEFGAKKAYFEQYGVDTSRVIHVPFEDIEKLTFETVRQLKELTETENVIFLIDSIGNASSIKEVEDALAEKGVSDMSRAKKLKSYFRIITPMLYMKNIPLIAINHTYKTQELYAKDVVGGGCVVAGTKIIMADGTIKNIEDVLVGETVKTKDGDNKVTHTWNPTTLAEGNAECLEIEFDDGTIITCTKKHKFWMNNEWVEAQNLVVGNDLETI